MNSNPILIFDGTNTFHRNFVVNPTSDINGNPIGGIIGTIRSIKYMIAEVKPQKVIFVWDGVGGSRRRRGIVSEYKMGRKPRLNREVDEGVKDSKENFSWQVQKLKNLLSFLGVIQIEIADIEADDTIGYLVGLLDPTAKVVVSSDRDMWQLISDTTIVYWPTKKVFISKGTFNEHSPIIPENYVLARAIAMGDNSDNIKGLKGLGEKTLLKLFPMLTSIQIDFKSILEECKNQVTNSTSELKGLKRWYKVILENQDIINTNLKVMQLTSPEISIQAASIIKNAANMKPSFNMTGFKIALVNNQIQLVDNDMFPVFQQYRASVANS